MRRSAVTERPLRIMRIIARLNVGGPAIHVALLTQRLAAPGCESLLVAGQVGADEGDMSYYAESLGVQPIILPALGRSLHPLRDLQVIWRLYRLMRRFKPDVVHTHTAKAGFVGRVAAWLAGAPVIVHTFHGHVFRGYFSPTMTRVFLVLERLTAGMSSAVITLTEGLKREIAEEFGVCPPDKIVVLGLGLDLGRFAAAPRRAGTFRAAHGVPTDAPLIGIVGRLVPVKNHRLFLQAAALVLRQEPAARFVIVGDGEARAAVEAEIAALDLGGAVQITGWVRDLPPVYSDLDVMALSSVNEGTPVTLIEALAAGCPVASTAVGGVPDLLEGGRLGALAPSGDAEALAAAMRRALRQPPDPEPIRALMLERYGIDRLVGDLDALYRRLLERRL
ncbi:MAG: glycosyltransferase [Anaerolineae bacterium]|nr:glycosyltransferase [Anaerolineae bacterium]